MSVVIASSLGAPIREQDTLIASISAKARTPILFLRIASSTLAALEVSGGLGNPKSYFRRMHQGTKLLSSCKDAANGQSALIRILLELAQKCNSGSATPVQRDHSQIKKLK
jgi:hypothetical protein